MGKKHVLPFLQLKNQRNFIFFFHIIFEQLARIARGRKNKSGTVIELWILVGSIQLNFHIVCISNVNFQNWFCILSWILRARFWSDHLLDDRRRLYLVRACPDRLKGCTKSNCLIDDQIKNTATGLLGDLGMPAPNSIVY